MSELKEKVIDDTHQRILDAAEARFKQFGFNKTTMAEIAADCNMSAANLYRYFENKLAIGAAMACNCLGEGVDKLKEVVYSKEVQPAEKIRQFILTTLDHTYTGWSETPRINELVTAICHEKMDIVDQHVHQKKALLVTLLKEGNKEGDFDVADPDITADAILTAITLFDVPLLMPMFSRQAFERKAESLAELLLNGLLKK